MEILLVEDSGVQGRMVESTLGRAGYSVHWVQDAASFHAALERFVPAVIILDIALPDASGIDLLRELRANGRTATVPVLMMTANSAVDVISGALDAGANSYLVKPFTTNALRRRVGQLLAGVAPED